MLRSARGLYCYLSFALVTTALPAPYCFPFSLFHVLHSRALSHALARASPCCSPSHVIVPSAHCFPMYLASFDRHLETLVSTSCLQVSPYVLRSVDTSLNTFLSPALPVEPSSSLAAQRPARRSCLSRSSPPLRSTPSHNIRSKLPPQRHQRPFYTRLSLFHPHLLRAHCGVDRSARPRHTPWHVALARITPSNRTSFKTSGTSRTAGSTFVRFSRVPTGEQPSTTPRPLERTLHHVASLTTAKLRLSRHGLPTHPT